MPTEPKVVDPMLKRYIENALIQVVQEEKAATYKIRWTGQGSRQRAKKRALANASKAA